MGEMAVDDAREDVCEIGVRIDAARFACFDQRGDHGPILSAVIRSGEERVLAIEGNCPFILPVSGLKSRFTIAGTRCTAGACGCITARYGPGHG